MVMLAQTRSPQSSAKPPTAGEQASPAHIVFISKSGKTNVARISATKYYLMWKNYIKTSDKVMQQLFIFLSFSISVSQMKESNSQDDFKIKVQKCIYENCRP